MYVGYNLSRFANRHLPLLVSLSRARTTPLRAAIPFLSLGVVVAIVALYVLRLAAELGELTTGPLAIASGLYVVALTSCLLGDTMKREWHRKWRPEHFPDLLDDGRFLGLFEPNRAVYALPDGTRFVVRIRRMDRDGPQFERVDADCPTEPVNRTAPTPPVGFDEGEHSRSERRD